MLDELTKLLSDEKNRHLALLAGGTAGLMAGGKATPVAMMLAGMKGLEDRWRAEHPEFRGGLKERFDLAIEFYDQTHRDPVNRALHTVGIPMIVGGFLGMLAAPRWTPPWWIANGSWTVGWALNFVGHGAYEKGAPAFADDPLSFVAGPVWDFIRLRDKIRGAVESADEEPVRDAAPAAA